MMRQLPRRYVDLFLRACADAQKSMAPVRLEGEMERADGGIGRYGAVCVPGRGKAEFADLLRVRRLQQPGHRTGRRAAIQLIRGIGALAAIATGQQ